MPFITFSRFVEDLEAKQIASKDTILGILKEKLNITDDDTIMSMNTSDISPDVINDLINRGIISNSNPDLVNQIKNGMSISDLINSVSQS